MSETNLYSSPTLIYNWHKNREAYPKDYDYATCPEGKKKLNKSTYKHFGTDMDTDWSTSTGSQMSQYLMKNEYEPKQIHKPMVKDDHFQLEVFDRRSVRELYSTYTLDYQAPWDYSNQTSTIKGPENSSPAYRKPQSQFTDTADYRRVGRNTWQDESGAYNTMGATSRAQALSSKPFCP
ncbi:hypothetical protein UPYG_G00179250 [Umbra pygmaea]|uniref:Uncharacterized protein n=1 Tax=Umbra pygmaea TaxID=75934 RepID=A0ABD0XFH2_UMBPY